MRLIPSPFVVVASSVTWLSIVSPSVRAQEPASESPSASAPEKATESADKAERTPDRKPKRRFRIGPDFGVFFPASQKTRDRFGQNWQQFSLGLGGIAQPNANGVLKLDFSILSNSRGDNRATVIPVGLAYRQALTPAGSFLRPYLGVNGGLVLATLRSRQDNQTSGFRGGWGGGAVAGLTFGSSGFLEASYQATTRIRSFDFSGTSIALGVRF